MFGHVLRMPGNTGGSSGRPVGNMATNIASYETIRAFARIAVIFFCYRFCFMIYNYISVIAVIDIGLLIVHLWPLELIRR